MKRNPFSDSGSATRCFVAAIRLSVSLQTKLLRFNQTLLTKSKRPHVVLNTLPLPLWNHIRLVLQSNILELCCVEPIPSCAVHICMRPGGQMVDGLPVRYPDHSVAAIIISCNQRRCFTKDWNSQTVSMSLFWTAEV